ncbi:hypothetical protein [Methanoculleus taiwanensis]|uniref:hypothetical protein n=1 Tax=Methanoculleus taiwanensis TaxID=1550565 RepID=UPI000FFE6416|nr:hypothetical protein [Methanoculleus taiwanensis]
MLRSLIALLLLLFCVNPATAAVVLFTPQSDLLILSDGVKEMINGPSGEVIFATDRGLSVYDAGGAWHAVKMNRNSSEGLLRDMVTAVELDHRGRLWLGYPGGLQISDGTGYETIRDQQLLKNLQINDITRRDAEIWVATGHSGLHCCVNGTWVWYKPYGEAGLGCREIVSMAVDAGTGSLVAGSSGEGVWVLERGAEPDRFRQVTDGGRPLDRMQQVRPDPFGGVYIFNRTEVLRFSPPDTIEQILDVDDLGEPLNGINDLAATPHGMLFLATDRGIFGWDGDGVGMHLTAGDGIGSDIVKSVFIDTAGRCWFVVPGAVGYLPPVEETSPLVISAPAEGVAVRSTGAGDNSQATVLATPVACQNAGTAPLPEETRMDAGGEALPGADIFAALAAVANEALGDSAWTLQRSINGFAVQVTGSPVFPDLPDEMPSEVASLVRNQTGVPDTNFIEGIGGSVRGIFGEDPNETGQFNESGVHDLIDRYVPGGMEVDRNELHSLIDRSSADMKALNRSAAPQGL